MFELNLNTLVALAKYLFPYCETRCGEVYQLIPFNNGPVYVFFYD